MTQQPVGSIGGVGLEHADDLLEDLDRTLALV